MVCFKMEGILKVICLSYLVQICLGESEALRGPPKVEKNPQYSSSYIPAAMQIIAHDTELMKYVIKPPPGTTTTTTTTMRPTPPHKPAVYAPSGTLGPTAYFSKTNIYGEYVQRQQQPSGLNYFNRYYPLVHPENDRARKFENDDDIYDKVEVYLGKSFSEVLRLANTIDPEYTTKDEDSQLKEFSDNFEDKHSAYKFEILRQKRVPPTKAYVTLLSLYDLLNKESKRLMLNKYAGYTEDVITNLVKFSSSSSSYQLRSVLNKVFESAEPKKADIVMKLKSLIADLDQEKSYLNDALKDIPPLVFAH